MKDSVEHYFKVNEGKFESEILGIIETDGSLDRLIDTSFQELKETLCKDCSDNDYYLKNICRMKINDKFETLRELESKRDHIFETMEKLKLLKLPEQRSEEWYEIREGLLTASSLADALGKGHFTTRDQLLINKTSDTKPDFSIHPIMEWGVKYEPVATMFYEKMNNLKIVEFGLIPHSELSVFGASPDGICDTDSPKEYIGRMLEIKCPPRRKFTEEVPLHYWMQMQGQLEVCDLEECDFLQVKIEEYNSFKEYIEASSNEEKEKALPKGLVVSFKIQELGKQNYSIHYEYSPWDLQGEALKQWGKGKAKETLDIYREKNDVHCSILEEKYWYISRHECTLVRRDRKWWFSVVPDIIKFWEEVVFYRIHGNEEVQKKIDSRKRKKKPETTTYTVPKLAEGCHILSSSSSSEEDDEEEENDT